jgi:thioredoxin 1
MKSGITMAKIEELNDATFFDAISQDGVVVVDVYANWCEPCQRMMKILPNLADKLEGTAKLCKVEIDDIPNASTVFDVKSIPTFLFFKNGSEVQRFTGIKPLAEVEQIARSL